ncbi:MAG: hypothetical protein A3E84_04085 [Gammaproteobacteria bacterium RIFCSPHIGHO2_12_FULL_42_13]|nr:MAG: hypothetical protein A3E84_04085 [Gammaproteobacteria bacterium RIFCSPHIGHO2_12_FULL_42_13]
MLKKVVIFVLLAVTCAAFSKSASTAPQFTSNKKPIYVRQGQTFNITLQSNPTTGFSWKWKSTAYDRNLVSLVNQKYVAATDKKLVGAPGYEVWTFRANKTETGRYRVVQVGHIVMDYERPWEKNSALRKTFVVRIK